MSIEFTWFGHATIGLKVGDFHLLVDPFFSHNPSASANAAKVEANFILITHGHGDHVGDTVAIAKRCGATVISCAEICHWLERQGVDTVHAMHLGGGHRFPFGYLKMTYALHGSSMPDGSYGGNPGGFLLTTPSGEKVYIAGDTGLFGDMRLIGEEGIDLAVLPIGDNYTMGPVDALRAVKLIQPKHVIPYHFSTWDLVRQDAAAWCEQVQSQTTTLAHLLKPGDHFKL